MTLPRIRAGARSRDTSTAVTVTNPTRGSRTLAVRNAATVWRISSATRSGRRRGREEGTDRRVMSQKARARVHDAGAVRPVHQAVGLPEHALGVAPLVRHHTDRQLGALPQVVVGRFRGRDVEAVVEPVLEALQDVTLLLQRAAPLEVQLPGHHPHHHGSRPLAAIPPVERAGDLLDAIRFDQVADLDVVEVLDADAALEALPHLAHVVLEALEGGDRALVHLHAVADHPHPRRPGDDPGAHEAPRDGTDLGDLKRLSHLGLPQHDFLLLGREQSLHCSLHLFHRLVDDAVGADLHALALGRGACVGIGSHVEADDDGTRRLREQDIRVGDGADAAVHDFHLDFRGGQLGQRVRERFRGAALVRLDDDAQRRGAPGRALRHEVLERLHASAAAVLRLALPALALLGDLARRPGIRPRTGGVPRLGHTPQAQELHARRGNGGPHHPAARVVPPSSSSTTWCDSRSCFTFCTLAAGRSILLIATTRGTPAFLAWEMASIVCGMIASSAATTSTTMSVTWAPRARIAVNASCPGVSRKVIDRPSLSVTW